MLEVLLKTLLCFSKGEAGRGGWGWGSSGAARFQLMAFLFPCGPAWPPTSVSFVPSSLLAADPQRQGSVPVGMVHPC